MRPRKNVAPNDEKGPVDWFPLTSVPGTNDYPRSDAFPDFCRTPTSKFALRSPRTGRELDRLPGVLSFRRSRVVGFPLRFLDYCALFDARFGTTID